MIVASLPWLRSDFASRLPVYQPFCYPITGPDGGIMVPVLYNTGSGMAWIVYTDSTGILQELMVARQSPGNTQAITRQCPGLQIPIGHKTPAAALIPARPSFIAGFFACSLYRVSMT